MTELQESIMFPSKEVEEETEITLQIKKDRVMRCKAICLERMGKHPLFSVSCLNQREKKRLVEMVQEMFWNMPDEIITAEFNELCSETIFDLKADYTAYSVSEPIGFPEPPPFNCDMSMNSDIL